MSRRTLRYVGLSMLVGLVWVSSIQAAEVFLNNVKVTGLSDQEFKKVDVKLDAKGNVLIIAPEYKIQEVGPSTTTNTTSTTSTATPTKTADKPAPNPANLTKQYFIITEVTRPKVTGYSIQLIVNNKFIKDLHDNIPQHVVELNEYLKAGENTVSFRARRLEGKSAQSTVKTDVFGILIGVGKSAAGSQLVIEDVLHEFKVSAIDRGEKSKSFTLQAK